VWRILVLFCLPLAGFTDERWISFQSGPFEVFTDAGAKAGRETLVRFEQLRYALGQIVGDDNLTTPRPLRIFVFKNAREASAYPSTALSSPPAIAWLSCSPPASAAAFRQSRNTGRCSKPISRMPESIERAAGRVLDHRGEWHPLPPRQARAARRAHARLGAGHIYTESDYYGKLRVIITTCAAASISSAYRNAIAKPRRISKLADQFKRRALPDCRGPEPPHERAVLKRPVEPAPPAWLWPTSCRALPRLIRKMIRRSELAEAWGLWLLTLTRGRKMPRAHFAKAMEADPKCRRLSSAWAR
jgi:hypothetical protein